MCERNPIDSQARGLKITPVVTINSYSTAAQNSPTWIVDRKIIKRSLQVFEPAFGKVEVLVAEDDKVV